MASWVAILGNAVLAIVKIVAGFVSGSLAVVADGIDSSSDIITSFITLFTARILSKPPDIRFPYGYQKADSIATKLLSFVMFFAGAQLAVSSIKKLVNGTVSEMPTKLAIIVTVVSIIGKVLLAIHQKKVGKKLSSDMLVANGRNMQNDVLISCAVLTGLFFTFILKLPLIDSIFALIVSFWILKVAYEIFIESNYDLMDGLKDCSVYNEIFRAIEKVNGVQNPHRVRARKIGNKLLVSVDIEVDGKISLNAAHNISHQVEKSIKENIENIFDVVIHVEPVGDHISEKEIGVSKKDL